MLKKLYIQNYAIIEHLNLDLDAGLTIITGETGAGKSILLGALGLIMGKRADSKVLFDPNLKCVVETEFDINSYQLQSFFEQNDIDYEENLIIRREIAASGKSRAFINDTPSNLTVVKELTAHLLDMHQQFDTLGLQQKSFQTTLLDALAGNQNHLSLYSEQFKKYQSDRKKLTQLREQEKSANQEHEFILFQLKEFGEVALISGEENELDQNLSLMESAESIKSIAERFDFLVNQSENSITQQLSAIAKEITSLDSDDPTLKSAYERLLGTNEELLDTAKELEGLSARIDFDPKKINQLRERQDSINRLLNKHRANNVEDLISIREDLQTRADAVSDLSGTIKKLEVQVEETQIELATKAKKISSKRKKAIPSLEKKVHALLAQLSMGSAQLKIKLESDLELKANGSDDIEFTFASNVGSSFQSIKDVASGGEMSRLSLCIKSIVADAISLPSMIFDEIDTGVSGKVSLKMGMILKDLSKGHQVISITHSPPIAAQADKHLFIYKEDGKERTFTHLKEIEGEEKVMEIAKMMSGGDPPTDRALANAAELLAQ